MFFTFVIFICAAGARARLDPPDHHVRHVPRILSQDGSISEQVMQLQFENNYLKNKLEKQENETREAIKKIAKLEIDKESLECGMWTLRARTAMEDFEEEFGKGANMTLTEVEKKRVEGNYLEEQRLRREKKYNWIFENKTDEFRVKLLKANIESRTLFPRTTQEYSYGAAWTFRYLCDFTHRFLSVGITGPIDARIINDQAARGALEVFLTTKFGDGNAILEDCTGKKISVYLLRKG